MQWKLFLWGAGAGEVSIITHRQVNQMLNVIVSAINNHETISFTYDGISRVAEPHAVGTSRTGKQVLRCFQTEGGHITAGHDWDLCDLNKMTSLRITGRNFIGPRPGYRRGDSHMTQIFAQL